LSASPPSACISYVRNYIAATSLIEALNGVKHREGSEGQGDRGIHSKDWSVAPNAVSNSSHYVCIFQLFSCWYLKILQ